MGLFMSRPFEKVLIVAAIAGFFVIISLRPAYQLRGDMPEDFIEVPGSGAPEKQAAEEKIARAYWDCAVKVIQWEYGFGQTLPPQPPVDFRITKNDSEIDAVEAAGRAHYWLRLQKVWYAPSIWKRNFEWDFSWVHRPVELGLQAIQRIERGLTDVL